MKFAMLVDTLWVHLKIVYAKLGLVRNHRIYWPSEHEVEFKIYKLPGNDQIPAETIEARGMTLVLRSTNLVILKVLLKFQLDVFYLFICRLYMFRATPIFRSFKCTLQTIGVCTSFDVLLHWIGYWLGHPRTFVTVRFRV